MSSASSINTINTNQQYFNIVCLLVSFICGLLTSIFWLSLQIKLLGEGCFCTVTYQNTNITALQLYFAPFFLLRNTIKPIIIVCPCQQHIFYSPLLLVWTLNFKIFFQLSDLLDASLTKIKNKTLNFFFGVFARGYRFIIAILCIAIYYVCLFISNQAFIVDTLNITT